MAERILIELVSREKRIVVLKGFVIQAVEGEGRRVRSAVFREWRGSKTVRVFGAVFADCTYEGDVLAAAGAPFRVGREARGEFNESHAGVVFLRQLSRPPTPERARLALAHELLNLRRFEGFQEIIPEVSTGEGEGDGYVQAFNTGRFSPRIPRTASPSPDQRIIVPIGFAASSSTRSLRR